MVIRKVGFIGDLGATEELIAPITIAIPTAKQGMEIVSDSANDAGGSPLGSGAQKVTIEYLDDNYKAKKTVVTLDGMTPVVLSVSDIFRINRAYVSQGATADGNITIRDIGGAGSDRYYIAAGDGEDKICQFWVPKDMAACVRYWSAGTINDAVIFRLYCDTAEIADVVDIVMLEKNYAKVETFGMKTLYAGDSCYVSGLATAASKSAAVSMEIEYNTRA